MIDYETVTALIKSAIDGIPAVIPADFQLDEYLAFAKAQQIEVILIIGLHKSGFPVSRDVRNILLQSAMMSNKQINAAEELYAIFEKNGIDYMPLKGCLLKLMYPSAEMRSMGDIDVLVRMEQYEQIRPLLLSAGYIEGVESDHEYIWDKNGIHIELHKRLIPSYNKDYYAYYGEGWQLAKHNAELNRYEMTPEDMFIYIFTHYAKHYRDAGVGIRQALDLYVCRKTYPNLNEDYIHEKMCLLQLDKFYENTMHMLDVWFKEATHTDASKLISDRLFASGVFGSHDDSVISTMLKQENSCGSVKKAKAHNWFRRIFPTFDSMCKKYPCLVKHPILLPFMWIARFFNIIFHERDQFGKCVREDITASDESVDAYREILHKSGLDFNFK